jgi:hypothetical protein
LPLPKLNSRFYAWWYFSLAAGFLLLALHKALTGERPWLIGIRILIAVGFAAFGYAEVRGYFPHK